jgi:hypothetical protein
MAMNIKHPLLLAMIVFLQIPLAASASNSWQVTIGSSRLTHYLDYPSSSLKSMLKLSVEYQVGYDDSPWHQYETFYYNKSLPVGCNQHEPLSLMPGAGGSIRVKSAADKEMPPDECDAVANATGRLFLDLYSLRCAVYNVMVPAMSFDSMLQGFERNGFHCKDQSDVGRIVLNLVSDPPGRFQQVAF